MKGMMSVCLLLMTVYAHVCVCVYVCVCVCVCVCVHREQTSLPRITVDGHLSMRPVTEDILV